MRVPDVIFLIAFFAQTYALDLSGHWELLHKVPEQYFLSPNGGTPITSYSVICTTTPGAPCAWTTANITVSDVTSLAVVFSNGVKDSGVVDSLGQVIEWADGSSWGRPPPPVPPHPLHIHIVPHSHMDPAWFQTVDVLYETVFKQILEDVILSLSLNPTRTFGAEHSVIFAMLWETSNQTMKDLIRSHVARGALEFTGGGWVQPDEAITTHFDLMDQLTLGHAFIQNTLGHDPVRTTWIADPFGRSTGNAAMHAAARSDVMVIGRVMSPLDPINSESGAIWYPSASLPPPNSSTFTPGASLFTIDYGVYCDPYRGMRAGFDSGNTSLSVSQLLAFVLQSGASQRPSPRTQVLVMMGDDAPSNSPWTHTYPALDAVIDAINAHSAATNITASYSTPTRFLAALEASLATDPPPFSAPFSVRGAMDMLPLVGNEFPYWVGYYTSRPELKQAIHASSSLFRAASQLHALARHPGSWEGEFGGLMPLWRSLGLAQHHDTVTGDCWDGPSEDTQSRLRAGVAFAGQVGGSAILTLAAPPPPFPPTLCFNASATPCPSIAEPLGAGIPVKLTLYNPSGWARKGVFTEVLVPTSDLQVSLVVDDSGSITPLPCQITPAPVLAMIDLPVEFMWFILACPVDYPPLGMASLIVSTTASASNAAAVAAAVAVAPLPATSSASASPGFELSNPFLTLTFDGSGGLLTMSNPATSTTINATASIRVFSSPAGMENAWDFSTAGSTDTLPWPSASTATPSFISGPLFSELTVASPTKDLSIRWRLYASEPHVHLWVGVGPFSEEGAGAAKPPSQDAFLTLSTSIPSAATWHTDSNGLELLPRVRWARPFTSVNYSGFAGNEPVAINSYPITSAAIISGGGVGEGTLVVLPKAASHTCTSMVDGELALMVNRDVIDGDGKTRKTGNRFITAAFQLSLHPDLASASTVSKVASNLIANPPVIFASEFSGVGGRANSSGNGSGSGSGSGGGGNGKGVANSQRSPLANPLPPSLTLLTLQLLPLGLNLTRFFEVPSSPPPPSPTPLSQSCLLLRLRHVYQVGLDDPGVTTPVTLDVAALFSPSWVVTGVVEMTLDGAREVEAANQEQIKWPQTGTGVGGGRGLSSPAAAAAAPRGVGDTTYTVQPGEVRTWILTIA